MAVAAVTGRDLVVPASVSPLDTDSASVGYRMDNTRIEQLPLATRNVISSPQTGFL